MPSIGGAENAACSAYPPPPEEDASARIRIWGTFSLRPEIWTAFMFAIGTLVIGSIFASIHGLAELVLGRTPFALLVPLASACRAGLIYVAALVGQGLSISDMCRLRAFIDDSLRESESKNC